MTAIRHVAAARTGSILAAGEWEHLVHLYDLRTRRLIQSLVTTMDGGGERLAISTDGRILVAGAYLVHGIAAYCAESGRELWRRKDLKKVQHLRFNNDDSRVLCTFNSGPCQSLNLETGKSGKTLRGVRGIWESPFGAVRFIERSRGLDYTIADFEAPIATIPRVRFAVLSAAFSPSIVCISEAGGPVRAFDVSTGAEVWRHVPNNGLHFLRLSFCEPQQSFVGISWPYKRGGRMLLERFSPDDGKPCPIAELFPQGEMVFCQHGSLLISASGSILDVVSGNHIGSLPFPCNEPPQHV